MDALDVVLAHKALDAGYAPCDVTGHAAFHLHKSGRL